MKTLAKLFLGFARLLVKITRSLFNLAYSVLKIALIWEDKTKEGRILYNNRDCIEE